MIRLILYGLLFFILPFAASYIMPQSHTKDMGFQIVYYMIWIIFELFLTAGVVHHAITISHRRESERIRGLTPVLRPFKRLANQHGIAVGWASWAATAGFLVVFFLTVLRLITLGTIPKNSIELIWFTAPQAIVVVLLVAVMTAFLKAWFMERALWHHNQSKMAVVSSLECLLNTVGEYGLDDSTKTQLRKDITLRMAQEIVREAEPFSKVDPIRAQVPKQVLGHTKLDELAQNAISPEA